MIHMGNFAISPNPSNPRVRGAANYRAGQYASAIADLNESAKVFPRCAWDWLFLAMAHYHLGHAEEAKQCIKKAVEWIDLTNQNRSGGLAIPWFSWAEPVEVEHLLREAKDWSANPGWNQSGLEVAQRLRAGPGSSTRSAPSSRNCNVCRFISSAMRLHGDFNGCLASRT